MKKLVHGLYAISLILVICILIFIYTHEHPDEYVARDTSSYSICTDYNFTTYHNSSAPVGIVQEYRWTLHNVPKHGGCISFYTIHQNIEIYLEQELLYSLHRSEENHFGKTIGCDWAKAFLNEDDNGKEICILVYPIYQTSIGNTLTIYTGNYATICNTIVQNNMFILIIGLLAICIGLVFICFVLLNLHNPEFDRSIAMLGMFSIFAGLWKITDMNAAPLIFKDTLMLSSLSIISLNMMLIPYILFVRNQFSKNKHWIWDCMSLVSIGECIIVTILQLTGIADLRQTLIATHIVIIITVLGLLSLLIVELKRGKLSTKLQITVVCCGLCLLGTVVDMIVYYRSGNSGSMVFGLLAFLIYIVLMGYMAVKNARELMERGKEAKKYEQLALHDELTGLYNRAFYSQYLTNNNLQQKNCYIVMLDVNNLKQCNDTIGHEGGDQLIINSAKLIQKAFEPKGNCVRMGGDEFCVILRNCFENECKTYVKRFDEFVTDFNVSHPECFPIQVAYGYTHFDERLDFDFSDTLRRADKMMYQMKSNMKKMNLQKEN